MEETAVEWLVEQLTIVYPRVEEMKLLTDKAKEKEKERMIGFAKYCLNNAKYLNFEKALFNVEEYYEIFKSE